MCDARGREVSAWLWLSNIFPKKYPFCTLTTIKQYEDIKNQNCPCKVKQNTTVLLHCGSNMCQLVYVCVCHLPTRIILFLSTFKTDLFCLLECYYVLE